MSSQSEATDAAPRGEQDPGIQPQAPPGISNPGPTGLGAFALTTFLLSLFNAGLLPEEGEPIIFALALTYGGIVQLLAGMWEFKTGNTFAATAFTSYGSFWVSVGLIDIFFIDQIPPDLQDPMLGWFLVGWGIFTLIMWFASFRTNAALALVFLILAVTFFLLGVGDITGIEGIATLGGYTGIVTAIGAWYICFAELANTQFGRTVAPTKPLGG